MKYTSFLLMLLWFSRQVAGQDTSSVVSVAEEAKEIRKQKFIDRYDNVFMTRVPTRHMLKIGAMPFGTWRSGLIYFEQPVLSSISLGYEYKLTPAFSVGISASGGGGASRSAGEGWKMAGHLNVSGQVRWYYAMKKRIDEGLSANNFSGNYFGFSYDRYYESNYRDILVLPRIRLEYGIQRRFMNHGFIDLGIGVYRNFEGKTRRRSPGGEPYQPYFQGSEWGIASRAVIGFAFGDWKKKNDLSYCEVLRCDEEVRSQLTVSWPHINIGTFQQTVSGVAGYEQKLFPSFSAKAQVYGFLNSGAQSTGPRDTFGELTSSLQLRYYFLQRKARKRGTGGYDLSGFYIGPHTDYSLLRASSSYLGSRTSEQMKIWKAGITAGYQKTLFRHAYVDVSWSQSGDLKTSGNGITRSPGVFRVGFGLKF